jgi:hypothetical protein
VNQIEISFGTPLVVIHQHGGPPVRAAFTLATDDYQVRGEHMAATMPAGSRATVSVAWKDAGGNTVKVDGPTTWASTVPATVECKEATGNPLIANLYAPGPLGSAQIQATADADLGDGLKAVTATLDVTVISGQAQGGNITFTPTPGTSAAPTPDKPRGGRS